MPKPNNRCRMCHSPKRGSDLKFIRVGPMTGPREYECENCHNTAKAYLLDIMAGTLDVKILGPDRVVDIYDPLPGQDVEVL